MEKTIKGILLRATDYREKDRILTIFTPRGMITATAKGVRTPSSKLKTVTSVLTYGEFTLASGRGNFVLTGAESFDCFFDIWTNPRKYASAMICMELTEKVFAKEEDTTEEFIALFRAVNEICYGENDLYPAVWYAVMCAEKGGVDFACVGDTCPDAYALLSAVGADGSCSGVVGARDTDLFEALRILSVRFFEEFGFTLRSIREAERIFYS